MHEKSKTVFLPRQYDVTLRCAGSLNQQSNFKTWSGRALQRYFQRCGLRSFRMKPAHTQSEDRNQPDGETKRLRDLLQEELRRVYTEQQRARQTGQKHAGN
jgi:hypothetical protein